MSEPEPLQPVDPAYATVLRLAAGLRAVVLLAVALAAERVAELPSGALAGPALLVALWSVVIAPPRRFRRLGYTLAADSLRVASGYLFRSDTVVPFSRIQHIDVDQGPLTRPWDLAALTVHTAGSHGASVTLPGLPRARAEAMREAMREHIRQGQG